MKKSEYWLGFPCILRAEYGFGFAFPGKAKRNISPRRNFQQEQNILWITGPRFPRRQHWETMAGQYYAKYT